MLTVSLAPSLIFPKYETFSFGNVSTNRETEKSYGMYSTIEKIASSNQIFFLVIKPISRGVEIN